MPGLYTEAPRGGISWKLDALEDRATTTGRTEVLQLSLGVVVVVQE